MKKFFALLLILASLPLIAHADADLAAMSVDELQQLRDAINLELASRAQLPDGTLASWTVEDGRIDLLRIDRGTDRDGNIGFSMVFAFTNLSADTSHFSHNASVVVYQGGVACKWAFINGTDGILSSTRVRPGGTFDGVICGYKFNDDSATIEVELTEPNYPFKSLGIFTVALPD